MWTTILITLRNPVFPSLCCGAKYHDTLEPRRDEASQANSSKTESELI